MARTKDPSAATRKAWETRRRNTRGGDPAPGGRERRLVGPVAKIEELGGGISTTFKAVLEDGTVGKFKLSGGDDAEVASWEVAKLVGMEDMVPAAVIRNVVGGNAQVTVGLHPTDEGSFSEWQEGTPAHVSHLPFGASDHDVMRAAMFDAILGNSDRHGGNWVVDDDANVKLIDNDSMFSGYTHSEFLSRVARSPALVDRPIAPYVKPYLDKLPHILAAVRSAGVTRVLPLERRVHLAASATTWRDFLDKLDWE